MVEQHPAVEVTWQEGMVGKSDLVMGQEEELRTISVNQPGIVERCQVSG
jgi:hypothetical protein